MKRQLEQIKEAYENARKDYEDYKRRIEMKLTIDEIFNEIEASLHRIEHLAEDYYASQNPDTDDFRLEVKHEVDRIQQLVNMLD